MQFMPIGQASISTLADIRERYSYRTVDIAAKSEA